MNFYSSPGFWAFLTATVGATRWLSRVIYLYVRRSNEDKAKLDMSVEKLRSDNIQRSIDYLQGVVARIEPLVNQHEILVSDLNDSTKMIGIIEKGLTSQFATLSHQYEGFESRITKITASYQLLIDRVDFIEKKFGNVIVKK